MPRSSSSESESDSDSDSGPIVVPTFKKRKTNIQEEVQEPQDNKKVVELLAEVQPQSKTIELINDDDSIKPAEEYEKWKVREQMRLDREHEMFMQLENDEQEKLRRRRERLSKQQS